MKSNMDLFQKAMNAYTVGRLIVGIIFGGVFLIVASIVIYFSENHFDLAKTLESARHISINERNESDSPMQDRASAVSGVVGSDELIGDGLFLIPGDYLIIERKVETYAWRDKRGLLNGIFFGFFSSRKYEKDWTEYPSEKITFNGQKNRVYDIKSARYVVDKAQIGSYVVNMRDMIYSMASSGFETLILSKDNIDEKEDVALADDTYIFVRKSADGTYEKPELGDMRIRYRVLKKGIYGTVFGYVNVGQIDPYYVGKDKKIYHFFKGDHRQSLQLVEKDQYRDAMILRIGAFVCIWMAYLLIFRPLIALIDLFKSVKFLRILLIWLVTAFFAGITVLAIIFGLKINYDFKIIPFVFVVTFGVIIATLGFLSKREIGSGIKTGT